MQLLVLNVAACAVAFVYCIYQTHCRLAERKRRAMRQRVAYMLWVMADRAGRKESLAARS
jgi:hypothetical protein